MMKNRITKDQRMQIWQKYGGRCAYCGEPIEYKDMQNEIKIKYYVQREGLPSMYDVQLADETLDDIKNIQHLIEHPADIKCALVEIYSSADKCKLKIFDTIEECVNACDEHNKNTQQYRNCSVYEHIVKLYKRVITTA